MPMRGELPKAIARPYPQRPARRTTLSRVVAAITDPEAQFLLAFGLIGALVMLNVALLYPDFGEIVAEMALFP
jgi:hypothetical protein